MKRLSILFAAISVLACAPARAADDPVPPPTVPPAPPTIADGVTIAGIPVGGLTAEAAAESVRVTFATPLALRYRSHVFELPPARFASPAIQRAVQNALLAPPETTVPLGVTVRRASVRGYVEALADRFARRPVDARLLLRRLRPWIATERPGREIDRAAAERAIVRALQTGARGPLVLTSRSLAPKITRKSFGSVIVIRRASNRLYLYRGMRFWRVFGVATGQQRYPTPLGRFRIVVKWERPWWYPPDSPWAKGKKPIPPGPTNPLGTRWMGISAPGVGIHGTPEPGSIGYSVSHGCIRMRIPDAEWLFGRVSIGTTVFIVSA